MIIKGKSSKIIKAIIVIFLVFICINLTSCGKEEKAEIVVSHKKLKIKDEELKKWKEEIEKPGYTIDLKKLKNPFVLLSVYAKKVQTKEFKPLKLKLVGIIEKNGEKVALLQDPTNKGYIIKEGMFLGTGKVKEIGDNYIIIEEEKKDIFGREKKIIKKLILQKEKL